MKVISVDSTLEVKQVYRMSDESHQQLEDIMGEDGGDADEIRDFMNTQLAVSKHDENEETYTVNSVDLLEDTAAETGTEDSDGDDD